MGCCNSKESGTKPAAAGEEPKRYPPVIFVLGGPGSGKGTQCAKLVDKYGFVHLSVGELLRAERDSGSEHGELINQAMKDGKLVPDELSVGVLKAAIEAQMDARGFFVDGFPRALEQAKLFEEQVAPCRMILYFNCPEDVLEARILQRSAARKRVDDNIETIRARFATHKAQTVPVVERYAGFGKVLEVSATGSIEDVYAETVRGLDPVVSELLSGEDSNEGSGKGKNDADGAGVGEGDGASDAEDGEDDPVTQRSGDNAASKPPSTPDSANNVSSKSGNNLGSPEDDRRSESSRAGMDEGGLLVKTEVPIIFVLGGPGSGKGTQCKKLVGKYGFSHFSAGDLLRAERDSGSEEGAMIEEMIEQGKLVPAEVTIRLLAKAIAEVDSESPGILIDGFPRAVDQADGFKESVKDCQFVLFFDAPEDVLQERLLERGKTSGRVDDNLEAIKKRFKTYEDQTLPVIELYAESGRVCEIDASLSVDDVFEQTCRRMVALLDVAGG